ncbi:MAG: hemolysin activation/secretion protein [Marinomonas primoryensis]|jgi:hemolysin activation/secretion protein
MLRRTAKSELNRKVLSSIRWPFIFTIRFKKKWPSLITDKLINATVITSLILTPIHLVQAADAGSLLLEQQQKDIQQLPLLAEPKEEKNQPAENIIETGKTIVINGLFFTGKKDFLSESFQTQIITEIKGKSLGIQGITQLTKDITKNLQQQGHLLARASLPRQDITEGIITIDIIDGYLTSSRLDYVDQEYTTIMKAFFQDTKFDRSASVRAKRNRLQAILDKYIVSGNVTKSDLEEALLRINDHPGISVKSQLTQGDEPNSSNLIVEVRQQPVLTASMSVDNFGSYSTGKEQIRAKTSLTDTTGYGDVAQLSVITSEGQTFANATFSLPVKASDFTTKAGYSFLDYRNIDDTGSTFELEGYANFLTFGIDYSLIRSRNLNLRFNANLNGKALVDDSVFGYLHNKKSLSSTFGIAADTRDAFMGGGVTYLSTDWTYGYLDLSGQVSALETDKQGLQTNGRFQHINISLARIQNLPNTFSLFGRIYGQWANKNLDSSEGFTLGGPTGVRGWPVGEASGDMGALNTIELRYDIPVSASWGKIQIATFIDSGHIWINQDQKGISNSNACVCNDYSLTSAGISTRWDHQYFTLLASYAQGLGSNPGRTKNTELNTDNKNDNYQFWLTATARF